MYTRAVTAHATATSMTALAATEAIIPRLSAGSLSLTRTKPSAEFTAMTAAETTPSHIQRLKTDRIPAAVGIAEGTGVEAFLVAAPLHAAAQR